MGLLLFIISFFSRLFIFQKNNIFFLSGRARSNNPFQSRFTSTPIWQIVQHYVSSIIKIIGLMFWLCFPFSQLIVIKKQLIPLPFSCIMSNVMMLVLVREVTPPYPASEERADYCQIICQYITRLSILRIRCLERRASPYQKSTC